MDIKLLSQVENIIINTKPPRIQVAKPIINPEMLRFDNKIYYKVDNLASAHS